MPLVGAEILDGLQQRRLLIPLALGKGPPVTVPGVFVERRKGVSPCLVVGRHRLVMPAIGLVVGEAGVDHVHHRDARLLTLKEQLVEEGDRDALLIGAEEARSGGRL